MNRARARRWATVAVALGSLLIVITIFRTSLTDDEPFAYAYGRRVAFAGSFARTAPIEGSKLPVLALNALPERITAGLGLERSAAGALLQWAPLTPREREYLSAHLPLYAGRLVTILFYAATCALVFCWGMEVYGPAGALGATVLIAFFPTLLGHAGLVTTDAAATCTIFAAVYALARCLLDPTLERIVIAGVGCGAALLAKYSALALAPLAVVLAVIRTLTAEPIESKARVAHASIVAVLLAGVVASTVLSAGYAFQHPLTRLSDLACASRALQTLQAAIGALPLPLPREFLTGLDVVLRLDQDRTGGGWIYLLGALSDHGFASYYLIATVLKTPLPFLLLLLTRPWRRHRRYSDWVWLAPVLWLAVQLSLTLNSQVGLRYLLPAFPFLALLAGAAWDHGRPPRWQHAASALAALCVLETAANCPRYLSYFNQLIGSRQQAYRYLADSNLDWDQARFALWRWQERRGGRPYRLEPRELPSSGTVVVRASEFVGVFNLESYRWLRHAQARSAARVTGTIGDAFLVFEVDQGIGSFEKGGRPPGEGGG
ncbi:MAG: glycosyltransferase family 39 protein [Deltaproteobacteria bacterium]|nr:glycosyltransferase family 39 protein [Deltaproteobacteria bacterium]